MGLVLPTFSVTGKRVLDVGCCSGEALTHFLDASDLCGIDIDAQAIAQGARQYPQLHLREGRAESLPYSDASFDVVVSRLALPYTDIPQALTEIRRVLVPGGDVFLSMHTWRMQARWFAESLRGLALKRCADHLYIVGATAAYLATGNVPARPWNGQRETFQTEGNTRRDLIRAGFVDITFTHPDGKLIVEARKPGVVSRSAP